MTYYQVRSWYGQTQFSGNNFPDYLRAADYADKQKQAMPRWYKKIQIVRIEEVIAQEYYHTE